MHYLELYLNTFNQFLNWKGKSNRTAFWAFALISILISVLLLFLSPLLAVLYELVIFVPGVMLCIRRARDAGCVWLALTILVPLIALLILGLMPSKR